MNNELCDELVDYLNGTLSIKETLEFEEHLKTCDDCREIVDATGQLPYLSDQAEPPAGMKSRILSNVFAEDSGALNTSSSASTASAASSVAGSEAASSSHAESETSVRKAREENTANVVPITDRTKKRIWWTPAIAAVLLFSLLGNAYFFMQLQGQQEQTEPSEPAAPETAFQSIDLQPSEGFDGGATAAVIEEENGALNLVVTAEQLAALEGDQVYQVWLIEGDNPIPAGAFTTNANGEGAALFNIDNNTEEWDTIAITLEPQAGNELPQGEVVLSAGI